MKKILFIILLILFSIIALRLLFPPDFEKVRDKLTSKEYAYATKEDWKTTYKKDVAFDQQNKITFPQAKPARAELYSGYLNLSRELDSEDIKKVIKILNDSSSYEWGEIGTFEPNKRILFYDNNGQIIGITEIDWAKLQTYSAPMNRTMKWGLLSYSGRDKLFRIIDKY